MQEEIYLNNIQARRFLLYKQGLIGPKRYQGENGVLSYIKSVGSLQFDPVDVCGKNTEIILQARIEDFAKDQLDSLLYSKRQLIDFFDKNLCIFPIEDWPYLAPYFIKDHQDYVYHPQTEVEKLKPTIRKLIKKQGYLTAKDIRDDKRMVSYWSVSTSLARVALETMYFDGELIIHHKSGTIKSYAFAKDHLPTEILKAKKVFKNEEERYRWLVERRIGAIGMLWNKAGDAWLGVKITASQRNNAFKALLKDKVIFTVKIENIKEPLYIREIDRPLLEDVLSDKKLKERTELIAPLDCLLWDRKLITTVFDFSYKWEIYTPQAQRKYGPYSLPVLQGTRFVGRVDIERKNRLLNIICFYPEEGIFLGEKNCHEINRCLKNFAKFNDCREINGLL